MSISVRHATLVPRSAPSEALVDKDIPRRSALHTSDVSRARNLSFKHFPRGVVNIVRNLHVNFAPYPRRPLFLFFFCFFPPRYHALGARRVTGLIKILVKISGWDPGFYQAPLNPNRTLNQGTLD